MPRPLKQLESRPAGSRRNPHPAGNLNSVARFREGRLLPSRTTTRQRLGGASPSRGRLLESRNHLARIALLGAALNLAAACALGAPGTPPPEFFQRLDANHDGRISLEEFYPTGPAPLHPRMKQVFESLDKDHAGTLSFADTAQAIATVSGNLPKLMPQVQGTFGPVPLEVHPRTKRAFIKVQVGQTAGVFLLDTGTSDTILHPDFARKAGVDFVEICMRITGGNMGPLGDFVSLVRVPDLVIEGTHFRDFHAVLRPSKSATNINYQPKGCDLAPISARSGSTELPAALPPYEFGKSIDGVLGANVIFARPVTLDLRNRVLKFAPRETDRAGVAWRLCQGEKTATVEADIDGVKVPLMLDSGAAIGDAVLINEPHHEAFRKLAADSRAGVYAAKSIRVAGQVIDTDVRCLLRPFERSVLGSEFFDQHVITVDIAGGQAVIQRNP